MSHIADQIHAGVGDSISPDSSSAPSRWLYVAVAGAMLVHTLVAYTDRPIKTGLGIELFLGAVNFTAVLFLFWGISRLVFAGKNLFVAGAATLAIVVALVTVKSGTEISAIAGWCAILAASVICGSLASRGVALSRLYVYAMVAIVLFSSVQLFPLWAQITQAGPESVQYFLKDAEKAMSSAGYSESQTADALESVEQLYVVFLRILPSMSVMAVMFQFSIGLWFFARWVFRQGNSSLRLAPFIMWKMPFALTPIVIVGVVLRLVGNEAMALTADNLLLILAIFYSITGLSLMEFFMQKHRFSMISKLLVYLLLFVSHIFGLFGVAVLGFVDSFFDWRSKYPLPLNVESS